MHGRRLKGGSHLALLVCLTCFFCLFYRGPRLAVLSRPQAKHIHTIGIPTTQGTLTVGDTVLFLTLMAQLYGPLNFFGK